MKSKNNELTQGPNITSKELQQLERVYNELCYFSDKSPKLEKLKKIRSELLELQRLVDDKSSFFCSKSSSTPTKMNFSSEGDNDSPDKQNDGHNEKTQKELRLEKIETLKEMESKLNEDLAKIRARPDQFIRPQDVGIAMKVLGKRLTKKEAYDLVWEADEKLDGVIDWEEFKLMFERNIKDTTGLEPAGFYHLSQFMIYDHDGNGMVSIDETMNMLYARLGRAKMESTISILFGGEDGKPIKEVGHQGGEIDFLTYWSIAEKEQIKLFDSSELGRNLAEKKAPKKSTPTHR